MLPEEGAAQEKLPGQGLRATQVTVGFHPHTADRLPTAFGYPTFNALEQFRIVLSYKIVELGLALGEVVIRELFHQAQHGVEGASRFAPGLAERPQPGHVNVSVAGGDDGYVQRRASLLNAGP